MTTPRTLRAARPVGVYAGAALASYAFDGGHPFAGYRFQAFWDHFLQLGLAQETRVLEPVAGTEDDALLFHQPGYLAKIKACSAAGEGLLDDGDTPAFPGVWEAALVVVGSVLDGVRRVMAGELRRVFVPIAGLHHARPGRAAGFCVLNDCAIAVHALRRRHGIRRIAYVDIDAHHGDGVFYAFETDPECFIVDFHEDGRFLYPGTGQLGETGKAEARGTKLNLPLPPGATDTQVEQLWFRVETFLAKAEPEFVILQCGADSLAGDPLADLDLTAATHRHVTRSLCQLADTHCSGRLLALGGGGYNPANLAAAWTGVVQTLVECTD